MPSLLVAVAGVAIVLAIVVTVVLIRFISSNRARQAERIQALQALANAPRREPQRADAPHVTLEIRNPAHEDDGAWDHTFREEPMLHAHRAPAAPVAAARASAAPSASAAAHSASAAAASASAAPSSAAASMAGPRAAGVAIAQGAARKAAPRISQDHAAASHPLFEDTAAPSPSRAPLFAMAVLVLAFGAGLFYILSSGIIGRVVTASPARTAPPAASTVAAPVELLSLRHSTDSSDAFVVTGLVQNPAAGAALRGVFAMVYLFDAEGRYFASSRAALDAVMLSAGGQSAFTVRVPSTANVTKYRVSFQLEDGAAVNHVDRRGTLPEGTTGDAVTSPERATDRREQP